jgi:hypothetical protein
MSYNINDYDADANCVPLPIDEKRLKEMKAMEEAEQKLIVDLFSTPSNSKPSIQVIQQKPIKKAITSSKRPK